MPFHISYLCAREVGESKASLSFRIESKWLRFQIFQILSKCGGGDNSFGVLNRRLSSRVKLSLGMWKVEGMVLCFSMGFVRNNWATMKKEFFNLVLRFL